MTTALVQAPCAQVPVPIILNGVNGITTNVLPEYVYVKVTLSSALLDYDTEERLESCGLECISPGEPFVVYGVVANSHSLLDELLDDPEVKAVELSEPAAGK